MMVHCCAALQAFAASVHRELSSQAFITSPGLDVQYPAAVP
jgi:hypothetical protein